MTGDQEGREQVQSITIKTWSDIPRPVADVWAELMTLGHPAWTDPSTRVFELVGPPYGQIGSRAGFLTPIDPTTGIPKAVVTEIEAVRAPVSRSTKAIGGSLNFTERLDLMPGHTGTTLAVELTVGIPPLTEAERERTFARANALVEGWIARGRDWVETK